MKTEPVAWMHRETGEFVVFGHIPKHDWWIPLYTHPVKELTDEEIWEIFTHLARSPDLRTDMIRFADSILRKAQK